MFDWFRSWFRPTIEIEFTPETAPDHLQLACTMVSDGINYWLKHDGDPAALTAMLRQMADDVDMLHEPGHVSADGNVIYPVFPARDQQLPQ